MWNDLLDWSKKEFSKLPWRKTRTLYRTLVSEFMLQQTTVSTVSNHFERFLKIYPNLDSLSKASEEEILIAWKGLGYYRRAKNLRKASVYIKENFSGKFPKSYEQLLQIDGVGPYTANALMGIGRGQRFLAVDANIERVLGRIYGVDEEPGLKRQKKISQLFEEEKILTESSLEGVSFRQLNEALMDLGRNFCQARKVSCQICPINHHCASRGMKIESSPKKKVAVIEVPMVRIICFKGDSLYAVLKQENQWLAGQYELPTYIHKKGLKKVDQDSLSHQYPFLKEPLTLKGLKSFKSFITKYRFLNYCLLKSEQDLSPDFCHSNWVLLKKEQWQKLSTASLKALKLSGVELSQLD